MYACAFLAERTSIRATQIMLVKYLQGRCNKCIQNKENAVLITRRIELNDKMSRYLIHLSLKINHDFSV